MFYKIWLKRHVLKERDINKKSEPPALRTEFRVVYSEMIACHIRMRTIRMAYVGKAREMANLNQASTVYR